MSPKTSCFTEFRGSEILNYRLITVQNVDSLNIVSYLASFDSGFNHTKSQIRHQTYSCARVDGETLGPKKKKKGNQPQNTKMLHRSRDCLVSVGVCQVLGENNQWGQV